MRDKPPSVDWYYEDFLSGAADLSLLGHGLYVKALCRQWSKGGLSSDEKILRRLLDPERECDTETWDAVMEKFPVDSDGLRRNHRAQVEMEKKLAIRDRNAENGKKGGRPKTQTKPKKNPPVNSGLSQKKPTGKKEVGSRKMEEGSRNGEAGSRTRKTGDPLFDRFWAAFPPKRREGKVKAVKAWKVAITMADPEVIIAAAEEYAASGQGQSQFVVNPVRWLNEGKWDDDREAWKREKPLAQRTLINQAAGEEFIKGAPDYEEGK